MNICISSRQQKIGVFQSVILVSILLYMLYDNRQRTNEQSPINYETNNVQQISLSKNFKTKRLPDVIIVGVKKSGTVTLAKFLDYHPSIAAAGEISFFEKGTFFCKAKYLEVFDQHSLSVLHCIPFSSIVCVWF